LVKHPLALGSGGISREQLRRTARRWRLGALVLPNIVWLGLFMLGPLLTLLVISFRGHEACRGIQDTWTLAHYANFLTDAYHLDLLLRTMRLTRTKPRPSPTGSR
jgi:ABC-type spermidine/putrescine transport system permease subunit I